MDPCRLYHLTMWAASCSWSCLNGLPEEMQAHPQQGTRTQAYSNAGYSSFSSPTGSEQSCKACGVHFNNSSLKHICLDCKKNFCPDCSHQPESGPCLCLLCERFHATNFQREELIKMKVKDLRDYLELREISTEMCREKDELVFLIIGQQHPVPQGDRTTWATLFTADSTVTQPDFEAVPQTRLPTLPTSMDVSPALDSPDLSLESEEAAPPQANGRVPPSQEDMAEVENAAEALTEEEEPQSTDSEDTLVLGRRASLSDLTSVQDIDALSVRQLKEILARDSVDYSGCCEKWELLERATRLYKEKGLQQLVCGTDAPNATSSNAALPGWEENLCKVCMDSAIDCVLLECGHMATCTQCGKQMNECPICRRDVVRAVHVFRS
ncbi:LOW QUALITY PROTEIN: E3 ubiquitin-protein ligase rififylin-like [Heteronotia binoei]|uniref:LOW QUALITY PROTEIN: E3 ubiquitin-protein ligase rififylin-like n=1 Tax=Heteronotia binoei TaxID=13085 RepID=UPI00292EC735|nr:LOW QUALITY PROTEIN: E3 ubiquitin-protein ligase rififylin-like [Heteronotia binoei]